MILFSYFNLNNFCIIYKVPEIKNKTVELNGVLVTHALITLSELSIKCAQHYSWLVYYLNLKLI